MTSDNLKYFSINKRHKNVLHLGSLIRLYKSQNTCKYKLPQSVQFRYFKTMIMTLFATHCAISILFCLMPSPFHQFLYGESNLDHCLQ